MATLVAVLLLSEIGCMMLFLALLPLLRGTGMYHHMFGDPIKNERVLLFTLGAPFWIVVVILWMLGMMIDPRGGNH